MSGDLQLVLADVDPARVEVQEREILGPHVFVDCGAFVLSIVGELDTYGIGTWVERDPLAQLPLVAGEVEIGLLPADRRGLLAEPLRHVPFAEAAEVCRLALAGNVDAFRPLYADERDEPHPLHCEGDR